MTGRKREREIVNESRIDGFNVVEIASVVHRETQKEIETK